MSINIPPAIQQSFQQAVDDMLNNIVGRNCKIFYPPTMVSCPNIVQQGDLASSYWTSGEPEHIHDMQGCNLCNGANFLSQEISVFILMEVLWKPSQFNRDFPADNRKAEGIIQTKGFCTDLNKVLNCSRMEAMNELGTDHYRFKLVGEPIVPGKIVANRYFYCLWQRI